MESSEIDLSAEAAAIGGGYLPQEPTNTSTANECFTTSSVLGLPIIPNLPDDVSIQILARLSRFQYPIISLVSKSWRSALNSSEIFKERSFLGTGESSLFLCIRKESCFSWYSEQRIGSLKRIFNPLPAIPHHLVGSSVVSVGPKFFVIGGSIRDNPSNITCMFDCRFNRWDLGPKMRVCREFSAAGEWNGKIFVVGGCNVNNLARIMNWAEVIDPKQGVTNAVPCPFELKHKWMHASAMMGSKFYAMADRGGVVYDVVNGEWSNVPKRLDLGWRGRAAMVNDVLYCYDYLGKIKGYDKQRDVWMDLRGVEKSLPKFLCSATMANVGGKLCIVWEEQKNGKEIDIMCAEIEVRTNDDGGLHGTVLRLDVILVLPKQVAISHCLGITF